MNRPFLFCVFQRAIRESPLQNTNILMRRSAMQGVFFYSGIALCAVIFRLRRSDIIRLRRIVILRFAQLINRSAVYLPHGIYSLLFKVVTDDVSIRLSSIQHALYFSKSDFDKPSVLYSNSSQYSLSLHSFNAISSFEIKSFVPCAYCASCILAPTEVPHRKSWLIKTPSIWFCFKSRQR